MKNKLEKYKKLKELFENKAEEIAILKNKYNSNAPYDYIRTEYDSDGEWNVNLIKRRRYEDDYINFYITENEILSDINELEIKYKEEKEKKEAEKIRIDTEKLEKEKLEREKREKELYEELKSKYELK